MIAPKTAFYKSALNSLYYTGAYRTLEPHWRGSGVIFTLHHVRPADGQQLFAPNRILEITPAFLEQTIKQVRKLGYEIVSLDEVHRRLTEEDFRTPFVSFTLDDGYADNYAHAFPIFKSYEAPFAVYVCTGLLEGCADLWWRRLEQIVLRENRVEATLNGARRIFEAHTPRQKYHAFETIYWALRGMPLQLQLETRQALGTRYPESGTDAGPASAPLSWDMLLEMRNSGLMTVGAHTVNHHALSKLTTDAARREVVQSCDVLAARTGETPRHFAYPYGDVLSASNREFAVSQELGFATAVTTRKGVLFPDHAQHLHALPRVSLNGDYQQSRYVRLFLSGAPFALSSGFRRRLAG